jgi:hypothetical protein
MRLMVGLIPTAARRVDRGRSEGRELAKGARSPGDQITVQATGTYRDLIVKSDDGRWLFKERKLIDGWVGPAFIKVQ